MRKFLKRNVDNQNPYSDMLPSKKLVVESEKCVAIPNIDELPLDPGLRPSILEYDTSVRDEIRRWYLLKGPYQPRDHNFPSTLDGGRMRRFVKSWFDEYPTWLEYSIIKDAAFCLCCYLFKGTPSRQGGGDAFVTDGFRNWKKKEKISGHVGQQNSLHWDCWRKCEALLKQKGHLETLFSKQSDKARSEYRARLTASVVCIKFLLHQGLAFRGHDESVDSLNQGNFLELLKFHADNNEKVKKVVLENAPDNLKMISADIQKDIINPFAVETTKVIIQNLGNELFSILVDEARDISVKEQMAVVIRFVNEEGCIVERFLGLVHIKETSSIMLKEAINYLLSKFGLSICRLRGQGYDGASNMRGEFGGLKTLILKENPCAYYVHCFAHQLQLTLVAVVKQDPNVASFFNTVGRLCNVIGASCKRRDMLRDSQMERILKRIEEGDISTGHGLNQEMSMKRAGDTRWGSHYGTIINLISLFSSILDVLLFIGEHVEDGGKSAEALDLIDLIVRFEFVFYLHMFKKILAITYDLSKLLQRKDQDIINAMDLVKASKKRLQQMREHEWDGLLDEVFSFSKKYNVPVLNMQDVHIPRERSRRCLEEITNYHHYRIEIFCNVIDRQLQELNNRFDEVSTELLTCMACFEPRDSFSAFDRVKLLRLAEFYPLDFSSLDLVILDGQLQNFFDDVSENEDFQGLEGIGSVAKKMVAIRKHLVYPLVYLLIKLILILPVATATVERAFSAMKIVKTPLRNRMSDELLADCLVAYIEKDILKAIENEVILQRFQNMKTRRGVL